MPAWNVNPGRFRQWRGTVGGIPPLAKPLLFLAALPGLTAALLSIVLLGASLLALLLMVLPVYLLVRWVSAAVGRSAQVPAEAEVTSPGAKAVTVRILDS